MLENKKLISIKKLLKETGLQINKEFISIF